MNFNEGVYLILLIIIMLVLSFLAWYQICMEGL
jgi:hypothetical protein